MDILHAVASTFLIALIVAGPVAGVAAASIRFGNDTRPTVRHRRVWLAPGR